MSGLLSTDTDVNKNKESMTSMTMIWNYTRLCLAKIQVTICFTSKTLDKFQKQRKIQAQNASLCYNTSVLGPQQVSLLSNTIRFWDIYSA